MQMMAQCCDTNALHKRHNPLKRSSISILGDFIRGLHQHLLRITYNERADSRLFGRQEAIYLTVSHCGPRIRRMNVRQQQSDAAISLVRNTLDKENTGF